MRIRFKVEEDYLLITFSGEIDHHTAEIAREKIDNYYSIKRLKNMIIDLSNINFMDSSGIGLIMGRYKMVSENGGRLYLVNVGERVRKILQISGILKIIDIYSDPHEIIDNI